MLFSQLLHMCPQKMKITPRACIWKTCYPRRKGVRIDAAFCSIVAGKSGITMMPAAAGPASFVKTTSIISQSPSSADVYG